MAKSSPLLATSKVRERRRKARARAFFFALAFVIAVLVGLGYLMRIDALQISAVTVSGTKLIDSGQAQQVALSALQGDYFRIIPKTNVFFVSEKNMNDRLAAQFPEFDSAKISRTDFKTMSVAIVEKYPIALWCGDVPAAPAPKGCLFLDRNGVAFSSAPDFSSSIYLQYFGKLSSDALPAGYLPAADFSRIAKFAALVAPTFPATKLLATADGDYQLLTATGTALLVSKGEDFDSLASSLKLFLDNPSLAAAQDNPDAFEYIDLRFGSKVYYKMRGQ